MGMGEGKGELRESSTKLAQSPPGEGAAWGCLASFISLGLSTRVFITKERREPMWGKDTGLATGSLLCLGREYSYQPIWCLPESLSIVPSTQTSPSLSPELPVPRAYLLVTGASISGVPKHILHGIKRENKVAHPFTGGFRGSGVWGGHGNAASLSYLARCLQTGALSQSNGRCLRCCFLFCEPKDVSGSRWVNIPSFIHTKSWSLTSPKFSATDGLGTLELMKYICCTDPNSAPSVLGTNLKKQPCSGHGLAQDITADRKGWAVISAGAALGLQMPLWSYMEMTKTRCNSLIFLSCLSVSIFKRMYSEGRKTWLRDSCTVLLPRMVLLLCWHTVTK